MTDEPIAALRAGQFWRTPDGRLGLLVTSVEGDAVIAFGALHGTSGSTHRFSEDAFRREFTVLAFDPVSPDDDPSDSTRENSAEGPAEAPRLAVGQTISSLMHSDECRCYCRWSSGNFDCDLYCYQDVNGQWNIHVAANYHVGECPHVDWTAKLSEISVQITNRGKFFDACERHLIDLPCDGESYRDQTLEDFKARLLALRAMGYRFPDSVLAAVEEELAETAAGPGSPTDTPELRRFRTGPFRPAPRVPDPSRTPALEPTWSSGMNPIRAGKVEYRCRSASNGSG